jgi:hypothetical protein
VRYDLADLDQWVETKKRVGRAAPQVEPTGPDPITAPAEPIAPPEPVEPELPEPLRVPRRPRSVWDAIIPADDEPEPFAAAGRPAPRRDSGYWGH